MWCWYYRRRMEDLLGGILSARGESRLRRHMTRCPACREAWDLHCETRSLLRSWSTPGPSPYVRRRVMAAIEANPLAREHGRFGPLWRRRSFLECALALALVLVALQVILGRNDSPVASAAGPGIRSPHAAETYLLELMHDPRTAYLSDSERQMLLGALVTPPVGMARTGGLAGRDRP